METTKKPKTPKSRRATELMDVAWNKMTPKEQANLCIFLKEELVKLDNKVNLLGTECKNLIAEKQKMKEEADKVTQFYQKRLDMIYLNTKANYTNVLLATKGEF